MTVSEPDDEELSEFTHIDPESVHLVGRAANRFTALLAKSEIPTPERKKSMKKSELLSYIDQLERDAAPARPVDRHMAKSASDLFPELDARIEALQKRIFEDGDTSIPTRNELRSAVMNKCKAGLIAWHRALDERPSLGRTNFGPAFTKIVSNRHELPEDPAIHASSAKRRLGR